MFQVSGTPSHFPYFEPSDSNATLDVRAGSDASALVSAIRSEIAALDAEIAPTSVLTMSSGISERGLSPAQDRRHPGRRFRRRGLVAVIGL